MNTLLDILGIAFAWIFYGATIVGLGSLFLGLIYRETLFSFSCCFWIGLALLVTALQIVNLFFGINLFIVRSIGFLGLFSFWLFRNHLDVSFWSRLKPWHKLFVGLAILWVADRALERPYVYDSALYHFSSVRWANEQPLPPGLGNLYGRLAFNQSYFLFVSFLNLLPNRGDGHNFTNSLLLVFTIMTILEKGSGITGDRARKTIFLLLSPLVFFFALLNAPGISSPSPDVAMLCLQLAMFSFGSGGVRSKFSGSERSANDRSQCDAFDFRIGRHFQTEFDRILFWNCLICDHCLLALIGAEKPVTSHLSFFRHTAGVGFLLDCEERDCERISYLSDSGDCMPSRVEGTARPSKRGG